MMSLSILSLSLFKNVQKADSIFYNMSLAVGLIRRIPAELKCKKIEISYN